MVPDEPTLSLPADGPGAAPVAPPGPADPATPLPAAEEPPRPATWQERPPAAPWCPEPLRPFVPELAAVGSEDVVARIDVGMAGWRLVGASRRGRLHAHRGDHREDALAQASWKHGWITAVSDGAGSAPLSRIGAELAVRSVVQEVLAQVVRGDAPDPVAVVGAATTAAIARVARAADESGIDPRQFRCTLLVACLIRSGGSERLVVAQVGDGVIATIAPDGTATRLGQGDAGEFSGEVACFVPDSCAAPRATASLRSLDPAQVALLLVASDGVEDPFYPIERTGRGLASQLVHGVTEALPGFQRQEPQAAVLTAADPARALAEWLRYEKRGENDDRTLVVAHRLPLPTLAT